MPLLYTWLIGAGIMAVVVILLMIILIDIDDIPTPDEISPYLGILMFLSALWFLAIPFAIIVLGGIKLRKMYQQPIVKWFDKHFGDEDEETSKCGDWIND